MGYLQISNISKRVKDISILSDVNLCFEKTGLVFIVGKSGAGKSTLMNIIGQLDNEYEGDIILDGTLCKKEEETLCDMRRSKIGFIFQDFNLLGDISVNDNIRLANRLAESENVNILDLLKMFDIDNCNNKKCKVLSGGERQRVAIARAVCKDSRIILADEPTGNLDYDNSKQVFDVLKQIGRERLVIVISHDLEAAKQYGDRIIRLSDGKVIDDYSNTPQETEYKEIYIHRNDEEKITHKNIFSSIIKEHLKNNRRRNTMVILICAVLLLFASLVTSMINAIQNVNSSVDAVLGNDVVKVFNSREDELDIGEVSAQFIEELEKINCNTIVGYHRMNIGTCKNNEYISLGYQVYSNNDFFKERMEYYGLTLPENTTDVIVNEMFAKSVFGTTECVGETFYLSGFGQEDVECTVHAVTNILDDSKSNIYITNDILELLYSSIAESDTSLVVNSPSGMNYSFINVNMYNEADALCYGRIPKNDNEIVINAGGFNSVLSVLESKYSAVSVEDLLNGKVAEEVINEVLGAKMHIDVMGDETSIPDMNIVGITNNQETSLVASMNNNTYKEIVTPSINVLDVYLSNRAENLEKVKELVEKYGYSLEDNGGFKAHLIAARLSMPVAIISALSVVAFILAFLFIRMTTKINIMNQTKEIGILKALGASNRQVKSIYLKENIVLFLCSIIPSTIIMVILHILSQNGLMKYEGIRIFELNIVYFCVVCFVGVITTYVATIMEVGKIAKMNLVDILRKNN